MKRRGLLSRISRPWVLITVAVVAVGLLLPTWNYLRTSMASSLSKPKPAPIDGDRAYRYLKQICEIGPRPAGSDANTKQRKLVAAHFKELGGQVHEQPFQAEHPLTHEPVAMVNLVGSWFPDRAERVVIGVHYDTRPFPDEERDPAKRKTPFLGANDGASGVAMLMEIAHHLKDLPTPYGVDLVLFDGEELVYGKTGEYFLGSKEFARLYKAEQASGKARSRYVAGLILDMIGGRNLEIPKEQWSLQLAPGLVDEVWAVARSLRATAFLNRVGPAVNDDHLPMNEADIPTIDLIDFSYPQWHTAGDTPGRCAPASLSQVGKVVTAWLALPRDEKK
jgi:Zn-dependent M28 family amino/carboxypeptidase